MSANFYAQPRAMLGLDPHVGVPMVTAAGPYGSWPSTWDKDTDRVTADGLTMIQDGHKLWLVVHIPIPPSEKNLVLAAIAIGLSTSEPFLCRRSVRGQGSALACCVGACVGVNANCADVGPFSSAPSGVVLSITSVVTTPSLGDWAAAVLGYALDNVLGFILAGAAKAGSKTPGRESEDVLPIQPDTSAIAVVLHVISLLIEVARQFLPPEAIEAIEWATNPLKKGTDLIKSNTQDQVQRWVDNNTADLF